VSIYRIEQQRAKSGLNKMFIARQRVGYAALLHHDKRNAINQTPRFIGVSFVKFKCFVEKRFI
jgi:hypothetical protein